MNKDKTELDGITALNNFISLSEIIVPFIAVKDKYPIWDGDILLYNNKDHNSNVDNLIGRVPVQVKSSNTDFSKNIPVLIKYLKAYLNDGGVLFIRPIFKSTTDYEIYYKILFPNEIKLLLETVKNRKKERQNIKDQSITINLKKFRNIRHFEVVLTHFIENRTNQDPIQFSPENDQIFRNAESFTIKSISTSQDFISAFTSDEACVYINLKDGFTLPIDLTQLRITSKFEKNISIGDRIYFSSFEISIDTRKQQKLKLTSALELIFSESSFQMSFIVNENSNLKDIIISLEFYYSLLNEKYFFIGEIKIEINSIDGQINSNLNLENLQDVILLCEFFKINSDFLKLSDLSLNNEILNELIPYIVDKSNIKNSKESSNIVLLYRVLFEKSIVIAFIRSSEFEFEAFNFFTYLEKLPISLSFEKLTINCSRFLAIFSLSKDLDIYGSLFEPYLSEIDKEIYSYFNINHANLYHEFLLCLIQGFDKTKNTGYLKTAENLNTFLKENLNSLDPIVYNINRLQIIYRTRKLNESEKKELLELKYAYSENKNALACICLLLENREEFDFIYNNFEDDLKKSFSKWPIYNLL